MHIHMHVCNVLKMWFSNVLKVISNICIFTIGAVINSIFVIMRHSLMYENGKRGLLDIRYVLPRPYLTNVACVHVCVELSKESGIQ